MFVKIQTLAQNKDMSLNNLIQQCYKYALKHLEKINDFFF